MDLFVNDSESLRKAGSGNNPELTLSYLCDKDKGKDKDDHDPDGDGDGNGSDSGVGVGAGGGDDDGGHCVERERDFMNLSEGSHVRTWDCSSKREGSDDVIEGGGGGGREKRSKLGTLNLSLALPDVSLSLPALPRRNSDCDVGGGLRSVAPSSNTLMTCSTDFTAPSMSCSYSHSHNPSCSLTRNSTGNHEYSVGNRDRDSQIWHAGEGTNGSVHSRFKPLRDGGGVALADGGGGGNGNGVSMNLVMQGSCQISRDCSSSFYQNSNSERYSYLPSELPVRYARDAISGDSRGKNLENSRDLDSLAGGRARKLSSPERLAREIVSESIPVMSQIVKELSEEVMESTKGYLRSLLDVPERSEELSVLQRKLDKRSDLTKETLSKCNKVQLLILVALRTGLRSFLIGKNKIPNAELVEIFLFLRCRNVNCKMLLPVDDCECKVCSTNRGFCSSCMCPVCLNFDCANNTCSWVGCDMCSHWCHASCGIRKNLIRPVLSAKSGAAEMHFFCMGCDHASEMYGFVKDVFSCCAKDWGVESLIKELDCVKKIFRRSEDFKGVELYRTAEQLLSRLETKIISPSDACKVIMKFFAGLDGKSAFSDRCVLPELTPMRQSLSKDSAFRPHSPYTMPPVLSRETTEDFLREEMKSSVSKKRNPEDEFMTMMMKDGFDSLESMIRIKEVEARMFQGKADDARREAEGYKQMIQAKISQLDGEYTQKVSDICVHEAEERHRKKLDELKLLENSHCDYLKMKMRMQSEIAGLLETMEATRQQWA